MREVSYDREGTACPAEPGPVPETGEGLLESYRAGDPDALCGIQHHHPQFKNTPALSEDSFQLSDAQWVIAREYGLESWPAFAARVRHLEAAGSTSPREMPVFAIDLDVETDELSCALTREGRRAITAAPGQTVRIDRPRVDRGFTVSVVAASRE